MNQELSDETIIHQPPKDFATDDQDDDVETLTDGETVVLYTTAIVLCVCVVVGLYQLLAMVWHAMKWAVGL